MASNTAFWKPGTSRPASALDRTSEAESSSTSIIPPTSLQSCSIFAASSSFSQRLRILHTVQTHQVTLIISESGADIINFLPQILHNAAWTSNGNIIAFTSPRRSTTISKANQLANSMGISLGQQVGYTVAFETNTSTSTIIHCVTDEIMFRELLRDPLLTRYSIVMVGEADHRAVYSDLLLALLNNILRNRPDLRVIISCASPRASQVFKQFFQHDPTLPPCSNQTSETSQTSQHTVSILDLRSPSLPVHIAYLQNPCPDYIKATVDTILSIHQSCPLGGHILAYLPTTVHINSALQELSDYQSDYPSSAPRMHLLPLHSALSAAEQAQVFSITAAGERKVIITTDAANALALEEIVYIIDSGLSRIRMIDPKSGIESFAIAPISQDIAIQRAAIARSRTTSSSSGKCLRLYTEPFFLHQMMPSTPPELNRVDITTPVLLLKALGIDNLIKFDYVPPSPPPQILARALKRLYQLCAIDDQTRLTATGTLMAELPLPAQWGRILLASAQHNQVAEERKGTGTGTGNANANANANEWGIGSCAQEILTIISMLQVQHPFYAPHTVETQLAIRNFTATEGDLFTLLNVFTAFMNKGGKGAKWCSKNRLNFRALSRALNIRLQLQKFLQRFSTPTACFAGLQAQEGKDVSFKLNAKSTVQGKEEAISMIVKVVCKGLYENLARYNQNDMTYIRISDGKQVYPHPNSVLFNRRPENGKLWVIYVDSTYQEQKTGEQASKSDTKEYITDLTVLPDLSYLTDAVPGFL